LFNGIISTCNKQYVIFQYTDWVKWDQYIYVVWDLKNQNEFTSHIASQGDMFKGYFTGLKSKVGYLGFDNYVINLDFGLPNPFFGLDGWNWNNKGPMMDFNESFVLMWGSIMTQNNYIDIQNF